MNSVSLIGRLTAQPTIHYLEGGRCVSEATLAVDDPFAKRDGDGNRKSYFFGLVIWGPKAEVAHQHCVKGQRLGISGRLIQDEFIPRDGTKLVRKTRISVENFDLLDKPAPSQVAGASCASPCPERPAPLSDPDDEIPF